MLAPDYTSGPDWKLDRRGSGRLFWRRDSASNSDAATRVKFRYDVEVLEFWEAEDAVTAASSNGTAVDAASSAVSAAASAAEAEPERRDALRARKTPEPAPPFLMCVACIAAIAIMICYQWMLGG